MGLEVFSLQEKLHFYKGNSEIRFKTSEGTGNGEGTGTMIKEFVSKIPCISGPVPSGFGKNFTFVRKLP
jgi:hypothetical protein